MCKLIAVLLLCWPLFVSGRSWFPVTVLADGVSQQYQPLVKADKVWRICALLPHGKDHYWWGVAWGLSEEATRLGVMLGIYEAGGYDQPDKQRAQLQQCRQKKADAYIIAAIAADGLSQELQQLAQAGIPVIDLINGIDSEFVTSHSVVSFSDMATTALRFILQQSSKPIRLGWFPGPKGAAWVRDADLGIQSLIQNGNISLINAGYGPPDAFHQAGLTRQFYQDHSSVDYVLANAVAAKAVAQYQLRNPVSQSPIVAYYANPAVIEMLQLQQLAAAVTDSPVLQARIAVDLAVRSLQGEKLPKRVSPQIEVLTPANLADFDLSRLLPPDEQWIIRRELLDIPAVN
jgi:protein TorT